MSTSRLRCVLTVCLALFGAANAVVAQQPPATQISQSANPAVQQNQAAAAPSSASAAIPSYPDTPKGLEDLMKKMLKLEKKHDAAALDAYLHSLVLPNFDVWFRSTFGNEVGARIADSYPATRVRLLLNFPNTLSQLNAQRFSDPKAHIFTDSCDPDASGDEYDVLASRTQEQPLYDVRLSSSSQTATLPYFAYVNGAFRYLGNFHVDRQTADPPSAASGSKVSIPISAKANVMTGRILKQVAPIYPQQAVAAHIQGKVVLHAIIGENGSVCNLRVIRGNPLLAASAMAAVRQWRYKPYSLNGQPVKVHTTIMVVFNLR